MEATPPFPSPDSFSLSQDFFSRWPQSNKRLGFGTLWKKEDREETQFSSSWALIAGLGLVRLWTQLKGEVQEVTVLFPNLSQLKIWLSADRDGNIKVHEDGKGEWREYGNQKSLAVRVGLAEGFRSRVRIDFGNGVGVLEFNLTTEEPRPHEAKKFRRLHIAPQQPPFNGPLERLQAFRGTPPVDIKIWQVEMMVNQSIRGTRLIHQQVYEILLSNGDVIRVDLHVGHHAKGNFVARKAELNRFFGEQAGQWIPLHVEGSGNPGGSIRIWGEDYDFVIPTKAPVASQGSICEFFSDRASFRSAPLLALPHTERSMEGGVVDYSKEIFDPTKGITLVPDEASIRLLNHPPWDERRVELRFIGEIGDRHIDVDSPLVIRGRFVRGEFVPDVSRPIGRGLAVFPSDQRPPIPAELLLRSHQPFLLFELLSGERISVPMLNSQGIVGFGTRPEDWETAVKNLFKRSELSLRIPPLPALRLWSSASPEIKGELARIFSGRALRLGDEASVRVAPNDPQLFCVRLVDGSELLLKRLETETSISYEVLGTDAGGSRVSALTLGTNSRQTLEGLHWKRGWDPSRPEATARPWKGLFELESWSEGEIVFGGEPFRSVQALLTQRGMAKLTFRLKREGPIMAGGILSSIERNGHEVLIFELEDGRILRIQAPKGLDAETAGIYLGLEPEAQSEEVVFSVEEIDPEREEIKKGQVVARHGEWILESADAEGVALTLNLDVNTNPVLEMRPPRMIMKEVPAVQPPPDLTRLEPEAPPIVPTPAPPSTIVRPHLAEVIPPPRERRFPWEEGAFILPEHSSRMTMRYAYEPYFQRLLTRGRVEERARPHEGQRRLFVFYGDPQGTDPVTGARVTSARQILPQWAHLGSRSPMYYGWLIRLPVVFRSGQWVPDERGPLQVERRFPELDSEGRVVGNFRLSNLDGDYPVDVVPTETGWGLKLSEARVIHVYQVPIERHGATVFGPDFGLSLGPPSPGARKQLAGLEQFTIADEEVVDFSPRPHIPLAVDVVAPGEKIGRIVPVFGDPIYRMNVAVRDHISLIDFSPGYSDRLPSTRFSQLSLYDGNGFNWRVLFQHKDGGVALVGAEAMGRPLDVQAINTEELGDGHFRLSGTFSASFSPRLGSGKRVEEISFQVLWHTQGSDFTITEIRIGKLRVSPERMHFNPSHWMLEDIRAPRLGQAIRGVVSTEKPAALPFVDIPPPLQALPDQPRVLLPEERMLKVLTADSSEAAPTPEISWVNYFLGEVGEEKKHTLRLPLRYDEHLERYDLHARSSRMTVYIDGEPIRVHCGRHADTSVWWIDLPQGRLFLGNFYTHSSQGGGRPAPLLWFQQEAEPNFFAVRQVLRAVKLLPGAATKETISAESPREILVKLSIEEASYEIPMRVVFRGHRMPLVIPAGAARRIIEGHSEEVVVRYYRPQPGLAAVIELDGNAYDLGLKRVAAQRWELDLYRVHRGEAGLTTDGRARTLLRVEPGDQSALILVDMNAENFRETIEQAVGKNRGKATLVRRVLRGVVAGEVYEFVFLAERDAYGKMLLDLTGIARLQREGVEIVSDQVMHYRGQIYVRLKDGQYLSLSRLPSDMLTVNAHGRSLERVLLQVEWTPCQPQTQLFSQQAIPEEAPANGERAFYDDPANRRSVRDNLAGRFELEPEIIWDMANPFPKGLSLSQQKVEAGRLSKRLFVRGILRIECEMASPYLPQNIVVTYAGYSIPSEVVVYHGRPFLVLGGPLQGVVFYFEPIRPGVLKVTEVSHPSVRERLVEAWGWQVLERPQFRPTRAPEDLPTGPYTGPIYDYPNPEASEHQKLREAIERQVAHSSLYKLSEGGALPDNLGERKRLAEILHSNPKARQAFEQAITLYPGSSSLIKKVLEMLAHGKIKLDHRRLRDFFGASRNYFSCLGRGSETERSAEALLVNSLRLLGEITPNGASPPPKRSDAGMIRAGLLTGPGADLFYSVGMKIDVRKALRVVGRGGVRAGVGGIPFAVGEFVSNWITRRANPTFEEFATTYAALAAGGGIGRVMVGSNGLSKRVLPLFMALTFAELARTGEVEVKQLPITIANVMIASGITHGLGQVVTKASLIKRIAQTLKLIKIGSLATAPETAGATLAGAALASIVEFTLLKTLASLEEAWMIQNAEENIRGQLAEAIRISNHLMERRTQGENIPMQQVEQAEMQLYVAEIRYEAFLRRRIENLMAEWGKEKRKLEEEEQEELAGVLDGRRSRAEIRRDYRDSREVLNNRYRKKMDAVEKGSDNHFVSLPLQNPKTGLSLLERGLLWFGSKRLKDGAREGMETTHIRTAMDRKLARGLKNYLAQRDEYHQRRNAFWIKEINDLLKNSGIALASGF